MHSSQHPYHSGRELSTLCLGSFGCFVLSVNRSKLFGSVRSTLNESLLIARLEWFLSEWLVMKSIKLSTFSKREDLIMEVLNTSINQRGATLSIFKQSIL